MSATTHLPKKNFRRYREIADRIVDRIVSGEYAAGDRLPAERELVEQFAVSRPTLREAIIALEIMGYVAVRGGSGIYVVGTGQTAPEVDLGIGTFELLEARKLIESGVAAIAAGGATPEQIVQLRLHIEQQVQGQEEGSDLFDIADRRFHTHIAEMTGNSALIYIVEQLWNFRRESDIWRILDERSDAYSTRARAIEDHVKIFAALEARDPESARSAMEAHMQNNIDWRLNSALQVPAVSDADRRTRLRLRLDREREARPNRDPSG